MVHHRGDTLQKTLLDAVRIDSYIHRVVTFIRLSNVCTINPTISQTIPEADAVIVSKSHVGGYYKYALIARTNDTPEHTEKVKFFRTRVRFYTKNVTILNELGRCGNRERIEIVRDGSAAP